MFPLLPWEAEMFCSRLSDKLCLVYVGGEAHMACWIYQKKKTMIHMWESVMHFGRWHWMSCFWAGGFSGTFPTQQSQSGWHLLHFPHFKRATHNLFLWFRVSYWLIPRSSHRSKRGSNELDYDSKRWLWGHCLDTASWELPQPLPPFVSLCLFCPVRHSVS